MKDKETYIISAQNIDKGGLFYLAHPYTIDPEGQYKEALNRTKTLMRIGLYILSPIVMSHPMAEIFSYTEWLEYDKKLMDISDGLILAPGWKQSTGCLYEMSHMLDAEKPIYSFDDIIKTMKGNLL